jgi:hypothetical protein
MFIRIGITALSIALGLGVLGLMPTYGAIEPAVVAVAETPVAQPLHILFVGDMFFDRGVRALEHKYGADYPFSCIDDFLGQADFVVGNLEGPITANQSVSSGTTPASPEHFYFTFPTTTAALLARHHIAYVTLGNNHINNFGIKGIASTHQYLSDAGVGYFGGALGDEPSHAQALTELKSHSSATTSSAARNRRRLPRPSPLNIKRAEW